MSRVRSNTRVLRGRRLFHWLPHVYISIWYTCSKMRFLVFSQPPCLYGPFFPLHIITTRIIASYTYSYSAISTAVLYAYIYYIFSIRYKNLDIRHNKYNVNKTHLPLQFSICRKIVYIYAAVNAHCV